MAIKLQAAIFRVARFYLVSMKHLAILILLISATSLFGTSKQSLVEGIQVYHR
jgi:hypothetical protein